MPITVRDYTWEETEDRLFITVPLKGVKANKVDIFSTEEYVKASYPPYLFECLLKGSVNDKNSTAQVGGGAVVFKLEKQNKGLWSQLQSPDAADKEKFKLKREEAIKRAHEKAEEDRKEREEKKREIDKFAVSQQMQQEDEERKRIQDIKDSERKQATEEMERWKEEQKKQAEQEKLRQIEEYKLAAKMNSTKIEQKNELNQRKNATEKTTNDKQENLFENKTGEIPLRQSGSIDVTFTPRVFPTAARETYAPQEEEWLRKQAEARKIAEIEDSNLSLEERDPVWLRDKGNSFFKSGNYQAAINVFNHAIRLQAKLPALYSNRAACHLKIGNYVKSVEDSSKALELLTPPVPQNAASRCKAHIRRGTAFCELQLFPEGLMDYEAALKIDPHNETLKQDAERIRQVIQGPGPSS